ncbi:MAG: PQQ-binding-like beta-propeller repeat protein [Planctomycetota bacterium]|nr:PQQ-binding-like beta-propeller repeat protein [Planctomycetota bacterium]
MSVLAAARHLFLLGLTAWSLLPGRAAALAQEQGIVVVDESPTAGLMVTQILDQLAENPDRSARLAIDVLESFGSRLVLASEEDSDLFVTARARVEQILLEHPALLSRFRELQEPNVERLVQEGKLERAVKTGWLTASGVHASLILAQIDLESGYVHAARERLDQLGSNPLLTGDQEGYRQMMKGIIAGLTGDRDSIESSRSALAGDKRQSGKGTRLEALLGVLQPIDEPSVDSFDTTEVEPFLDEDWHEVWTYRLPRSPLAELSNNSTDTSDVRSRSLATLRANGRAMTSIPLVVDDMVFVNDGGTIQGFDRYGSGVEWSFDLGPQQVNIGDMYVDTGEMAYSETALVAIAGVGQNSGRTADPEILCFDPRSGALKWRRGLSSISALNQQGMERQGSDFSRAFPYGGLVIESGKAVFTVRKVNSRRETVLYLVALDIEDGGVEWVRFLGSSGGLRTNKGFSRITSDRGSILVASPVGVVGRVDPLSGDPHWLRRFDVPISRVLTPDPPWQISQPVGFDDRIYALAPNRRQLVQLAWTDGDLEDQWTIGPGSRFGDPRYLLLDGHVPDRPILYAIGNDIHAMLATEGLPALWRFSTSARDVIAGRSGNNRAHGTRGRVQAGAGTLVVPGDGDVLVLAAEDGGVLDVISTEDTSNPVLLESQLILAGNDRISSVMQIGRAEAMLRERILEHPGQLSRVLGLMELGIKSGQIELAFEAARIAIAGLEQADDPEEWTALRGQLISMLLDLSQQTVMTDLQSAETCLSISDRIAVTNLQRARVKLAMAGIDFRQGRDRDGLMLMSQLLGDDGMASVLIPREGGAVRAGILGRMLISRHPSAADIWNMIAMRELSSIDPLDPEALREFGGRYPGTQSSAKSLLEAADLYAASGSQRSAMECLLESVRLELPAADLIREVTGRLADLGMDGLASRLVLDCLQRPEFTSSLSADALTTMEQQVSTAAAPTLGDDVREAVLVSGTLLPGLGAEGVYVVLREQQLFRLAQPNSDLPDWEIPLSGEEVDYAWGDASRGVLNLVSFEGPSLFTAISVENGGLLGSSAPFMDLFPPYNPDLGQRRGLIPGGGIYRPESLVLNRNDADSLLVYRRNGSIAMYGSGSQSDFVPRLVWSHDRLVDRIYEVTQDDRTVVVAGRTRGTNAGGEVVDQSMVVVIDSVTGALLGQFMPADGEEVRWLRISPCGLLLLGTRSGIEARTLSSPEQVCWSSVDPLHRGTTRDRVVTFGNRLVVVRSATSMSAIELVSGEIVPGAFELPDFAGGDEPVVCLAITPDVSGMTVLMNNRIFRWNRGGELGGIDAISGNPSFLGLFPTARFDLVLEELERSGRASTRNYLLHRVEPSAGLRISGPSIEFESTSRSISMVEVCPGWLLFQTGSEVLAISMPSE